MGVRVPTKLSIFWVEILSIWPAVDALRYGKDPLKNIGRPVTRAMTRRMQQILATLVRDRFKNEEARVEDDYSSKIVLKIKSKLSHSKRAMMQLQTNGQ